MPERCGLFGGTFDPVHNAHVALAHAALDAFKLTQVRWIPAGQPWQKARNISPAAQREAMVSLAIEGEPRFVLDRIETQRGGPSFTLDTVRALRALEPRTEWFLIIGQDQYTSLHTWQGWQELLSNVTLAVANRPAGLGQNSPPIHPDVQRFAHRAVPLPMLDISSTHIRQRVAAGLDISSLVPPTVARYIESHGLYRAQN
jgi:nicotinate-nucleotide adenylyltransferase